MQAHGCVRPKIKSKCVDHHTQKYYNYYPKPMPENEDKAMPYCLDYNGLTVHGTERKPMLDESKIKYQEKKSPGSEAYWTCWLKLHELCSRSTSSSTYNLQAQATMT